MDLEKAIKFLRNKTLHKVIILFIICLSLFPRSIDVLNGNPIFGFDQGRDYLAVKEIVVDHKLTLIGAELGAGSAGISGIFQGPFFFYFLAVPFILSNGNPLAGVFLMLVFSLASIYLGYYLTKKMMGESIGLLTAFLMAISPILIGQARFVWNPHMPTFFVLLTFIFFYLYLVKKRNIYIFLYSFTAGFIYNFEAAVAIPLTFTLIIFSIFLFKLEIKKYLFLICGGIAAFTPMILFELRHGFMGLRGFFTYTSSSGSTSINYSLVTDHARTFLLSFKETFPINNELFALIFMVFLLATSIVLLLKEKNKEVKYFFSFLILLIPGTFIIFLFLNNYVWIYYLSDLSIAYILLFSYVIYSFYQKNLYKELILLSIFTLLLGIVGVYSAIKVSFYDYKDYGGTAKLQGKIDAIDYVYQDSKRKEFGLLVFSPPIYTYPYDYLLWWHGLRKYGYIPYPDKKGTFYLLIEPDPQKPWTYKGWLETVIKTGEVQWTKKLPSGFIIQKRIQT